MPNIRFNFSVEMEDGTTYEVEADQRDIVAWEVHADGLNSLGYAHTVQRYIAWNALKRKKVIKISWDTFNENCVEVVDRTGDDEDNSKS